MIPHTSEARVIQQSINAVMPDIKLFWNHAKQRWVVAQVFKNPGGLLLPGYADMASSSRPNALYTVETNEGEYRAPSEWDVRRAIEIAKAGKKALEMGADKYIDEIEKAEEARKEEGNNKLRRHVEAIAPEMKRALRGDTFHGRTR